MSFFYDFLDSIGVEDLKNKISCTLIIGSAVKIISDIKIENLQDDEIVLECKKTKLKILGEGLKILNLSKGEIEITGNVYGVVKI